MAAARHRADGSVVMTWSVLDEPPDDDAGDAGGDQDDPVGGANLADHVSDLDLAAVVERHGDDEGDDDRGDQ